MRNRTILAAAVTTLALVSVACDSGPSEADAAAAAEISAVETAVADAKLAIERLEDVEELENLVGIYGYYADKSHHDEVADLFAPDSVVEILGRGVFIGQDRVRAYMRNLTPNNIGPREGSLFNHMNLNPVVHVSPDGETAHVRSRGFVMFGVMNARAEWGDGMYENTFVKKDGVWQIDYWHSYQTFYTLYEDGWAKRASAIFAPYDRLPPDRLQSVPYAPYPAAYVPPFHYRNPVSGRADHYKDPTWHDTAAAPAPAQ